MSGNVLDSGDAAVDKIEKIPVLTELIVDWCVTCILMAYVCGPGARDTVPELSQLPPHL